MYQNTDVKKESWSKQNDASLFKCNVKNISEFKRHNLTGLNRFIDFKIKLLHYFKLKMKKITFKIQKIWKIQFIVTNSQTIKLSFFFTPVTGTLKLVDMGL